MGVTTDPDDPGLKAIQPGGQQQTYLVLSEDERAKGFVRPLRHAYRHLKCGSVTKMGQVLSETYARDPHFYGGTFCCACGTHFSLREVKDGVRAWAFLWEPDGEPVGSDAEEAAEWNATKTGKAHRETPDAPPA
jgi:hypothetical protein